MSDAPLEDWHLTLRSLPGWTIPVAVRVRRVLRYALRACGLRCVSLREPPPAVPVERKAT